MFNPKKELLSVVTLDGDTLAYMQAVADCSEELVDMTTLGSPPSKSIKAVAKQLSNLKGDLAKGGYIAASDACFDFGRDEALQMYHDVARNCILLAAKRRSYIIRSDGTVYCKEKKAFEIPPLNLPYDLDIDPHRD